MNKIPLETLTIYFRQIERDAALNTYASICLNNLHAFTSERSTLVTLNKSNFNGVFRMNCEKSNS